jgi:hypothetical protein
VSHTVFGDRCADPCGWQVVHLATGEPSSVGTQHGPANVLATPAGDLLVYMSDRTTGAVHAIRLPDGAPAPVVSLDADSEELVPVADHQGYALDVGQVLTATEGRLGGGGERGMPAHILNVLDRRLTPVEERGSS